MILFLSILLIVNLILVYLLNGKKIFSPTIIVNGVFLLSALVVLTNWDFFGHEDISSRCLLLVMLSIYALSFGELFFNYYFRKPRVNKSLDTNKLSENSNIKPMKVSRWLFVITNVIGVYVVITGFWSVYKLSVSLGNTQGFLHTFSYVRSYVNSGNLLGLSRLITYPAVLVKASALYCMLVFCYNRINTGKSSFKLLLPGAIYLVYTISSTSRTGVLEMFCAFIIIFYAIYMRKNKGANSKLILTSIAMIVLVALSFIWLGNLRTVAYEENTASDLVNYIGSPLIVFSRWLETYQLSPYPGYATFPQLVNILNKVGILDISVSYDEMYSAETVLASSKSNLKTWLRAPIQDFTVIGMLLTRFLIGVVYAYLVCWLTKKEVDVTKHPGKFIFACLLFYPLISAVFADKFGVYIQLETLYMAIIYVFIGMAAKKWNTKTGKKYIS